jgi:hypothetical protein
VEELFEFEFFRIDLEGENFCFQFYLLMNFFNCFFVWKWWLIMCLFVVCMNYLDIVHLIIYITFHFYTLHFICTIALSIFLAHYIFFSPFQLLVNI